MFKLRYLCKYHLQLCAVLSQLLRNKEALQHGMMASFYCQELIRNTAYLCHGYINKLQHEKKQSNKASTGFIQHKPKPEIGATAGTIPNEDDDPVLIGK